MSSRTPSRSLPEELISIVCDHYAQQRQLGSLAQLMRLNRRTCAYARSALYRQYDFIDNRTSHFLQGAQTICEEYEEGEALDEDILSAIDCRGVDPLDLDEGTRWLRNIRSVRVVEIRDMLYGRDTENLLVLVRSLARRGILLLPKLDEVIISSQVVRRIHTAEAKYPKSTPMDTLIFLFLASHTKRLRIANSTAFASPHSYPGPGRSILHMGSVRPTNFPFPFPRGQAVALPSTTVGHLVPPHERAHLSHAIIQYMDGMPSLREIIYEKVDPFVPIKPKRGVRHTISFRPFVKPPTTTTTAASSSSSSRPLSAPLCPDERAYIWEILQATVDIIQRSVVLPDETQPPTYAEEEGDEGEGESTNNEDGDGPGLPAETGPTPQSSWHFVLPFTTDSSQSAATLRMQVRDKIRRKYFGEPDLVEEVLENISFEFKDG